MENFWRRARGKIKDRNSILVLNILSRNSRYRQGDLEAVMIKATSHDETHMDYKNARRVFTWVKTSPSHLMVFLLALSRRTKRTKNWVVALKSLILVHGVLCTKAPGSRKIGRLPFDLSSFEDGQNRDGKTLSQFVQAYFAFCDMKSVILSAELRDEVAESLMEEAERERAKARMVLVRVRRWQELLDAALEVRPIGNGTRNHHVTLLEAMDCIIIEVFDLYSKICDGIAKSLIRIYKVKASKDVASMALDILHKASRQGRDLSHYFHFCTNIGILHLTECPKIQQIPQDDFFELKKIINDHTKTGFQNEEDGYMKDNIMKGALVMVNEARDVMLENKARNKTCFKTVISDKWEVFDQEITKHGMNGTMVLTDPFEASLNFPPVIQFNNPFIDYGGTPPPSQLVFSLL